MILIVRERVPDPPKVSAKVAPHHMRWEIGRYKDKLSFGPGGEGRRKVWEAEKVGEQHNIILDQAYELIASNKVITLNNYAVVGTGSNTPTTSDTGLQNELVRTNRVAGGDSDSVTRPSDGVYDIYRPREFTPAEVGGQNLTEWGFSPSSTAANNLAFRELFRDTNGNPTTITLATDQYLRLLHTMRISLSPVVATPVSIAVTNLGTITGQMTLTKGDNFFGWDAATDLGVFTNVSSGIGTVLNGLQHLIYTSALSTSYTSSGYVNWPDRITVNVQPYTAGSRQRQTDAVTWGTDKTGTYWTIGLGYYVGVDNVSNQMPLRIVFDTGSEITKDNLHTLTFNPWTVSW